MAQTAASDSAFARCNLSTRAKIDISVIYGKGNFKDVYQGLYTSGPREGERCVAKVMKKDSNNIAAYEMELEIAGRAQRIIDKFNAAKIINKTISVNRPEVWRFEDESDLPGQRCILEPLLDMWDKFNSQTGA